MGVEVFCVGLENSLKRTGPSHYHLLCITNGRKFDGRILKTNFDEFILHIRAVLKLIKEYVAVCLPDRVTRYMACFNNLSRQWHHIVIGDGSPLHTALTNSVVRIKGILSGQDRSETVDDAFCKRMECVTVKASS
jgi:hypothetical protein